MARIERAASPLPRECSTTELHRLNLLNLVAATTTAWPLSLRHSQFLFQTPRSHPPWLRSRPLGAGEGNRTLVISLEGFCSTIELHPRTLSPTATTDLSHAANPRLPPVSGMTSGGGGWIRTNVGVSQQIYSLPPLATRAPLREEPAIIGRRADCVKSWLAHSQQIENLAPGLFETDAHRKQAVSAIKPYLDMAPEALPLTRR